MKEIDPVGGARAGGTPPVSASVKDHKKSTFNWLFMQFSLNLPNDAQHIVRVRLI